VIPEIEREARRAGVVSPHGSTKSRDELDGLVVNMELTLISIIQGVALYFLTESSRTPLMNGQITALPYIVAGLLIILLFWSRSLIHTFTVIRWPLEFGHNFGYIACTLVEAIWFTQLTNVQNWYLVGTAYAAMIWLLFIYDTGMIRRRLRESIGTESRTLFGKVEREQLLHARIGMPAVIAFYALAALLSRTQSGWFVEQNGHLVFAGIQLIAAVVYLSYVLHFFRRISPLILAHRQERQV
jgi:hypothetical protein